MAAIFPPADKGGVAPGPNVVNGFTPTHAVIGEGPLYTAPDCTTVLTADQLNAIVSELLAAVDRLGFAFNTDRVTNLGDALVALFAQIESDKVARAGDTMTGPLLLVGDPTEDLEASNKHYVDASAREQQAQLDAAITNLSYSTQQAINTLQLNKVERSGDVMTGPLTLPADPTEALHAATKAYVDAHAGSGGDGGGGIVDAPFDGVLYGRRNAEWEAALPTGGGTMTGALALASDPAEDLEAATKAYVDRRAGFESGTVMLFYQASAPLGWTKLTAHNDKALRVTSGAGGVAGGTNPFSTVMAQTVVGNHTLSLAQLPGAIGSGVTQNIVVYPGGSATYRYPYNVAGWYGVAINSGTELNYGVHTQGGGVLMSSNMSAANAIAVSSTNTSGGAHNHPITMAIQYIDVILARRD